jgi:hypothetical protein
MRNFQVSRLILLQKSRQFGISEIVIEKIGKHNKNRGYTHKYSLLIFKNYTKQLSGKEDSTFNE